MVINWYGEGCFKVQTGGLVLLTDPFSNQTGLTPPRGKFDIVLKTLVPLPLPQQALPVGSQEIKEETILGAGEYEIQGIEIKGFPLPKESSDKFLKTVYMVAAENINLCFMGHLAVYPDPEILDELENADVIFIPAGGKPFIEQEAAAKFIKQLNPKIIVNSFLKVPGLKRSAHNEKEFADELGLKTEVEEKLVLKKKDLEGAKTRLMSLNL